MDQTLFESLPKDVATLPSRVLSSLSSVKLLDMMEPKYQKSSTVYECFIIESDLGYLSPVAHDDYLFDTDFEAKR